MEKLKEYAGVIVAVITVAAALSGAVLWSIQVQIVPEFRRLDGRIESVHADVTGRVERLDGRIQAVHADVTGRLDRMDKRINARLDRFESRITKRLDRMEKRMDVRFDRVDARSTRVEGDIKAILLRLPAPDETADGAASTPTAH